jgi:hypothetical protein
VLPAEPARGPWPLPGWPDAVGLRPADFAGWEVTAPAAPDIWTYFRPPGAAPPRQGWKLHVSATLAEAPSVLRRALPVLTGKALAFKVARSPGMLSRLNNGYGGVTQVGKFITVFPESDASAVSAAVELDEALRGAAGPVVPGDRRVRAGSVVSYRFGGFTNTRIQSEFGELSSVLRTPRGEWEADLRGITPAWAADPFAAAGLGEPEDCGSPLVAGRYLLMHILHRSPRGALYLAVDLEHGDSIVVKRAYRHGTADGSGRDAHDRLRHEAWVLRRLAGVRGIPRARDLRAHEGDLYLGIDDVPGETLAERVDAVLRRGERPTAAQVTRWALRLAEILGAVHDRGLAYRDLKSGNVMISGDEDLHLIDLETAAAMDGSSPIQLRGTAGYIAPEDRGGRPVASVAGDVYGLGALLYYLLTGAEPALAPDPARLLARPPELLNPGTPPELCGLVTRCLDPDPGRRPASMAEVRAALADPVAERAARSARRIGATLATTAVRTGRLAHWLSKHPMTYGVAARDINTGNAGVLLALSELASVTGEQRHLELLAAGARWLSDAPPYKGGKRAGLYVGEMGVAVAIARAGLVLGDSGLVARAGEAGLALAEVEHRSPDLFNGMAGRLRGHLMLARAAGDDRHLKAARELGDALAEDRGPDGVAFWRFPPDFPRLGGRVFLGYAHGAAGIADALLDLASVTGETRFRNVAIGVAREIVRHAVPLPAVGGVMWADEVGGELNGAYWCRGSAGIGPFLMRASVFAPDLAEIGLAGTRTAARTERHGNPTLCHGVSGAVTALLDAYQVTGDPELLREAEPLARILDTLAVDTPDGLAWAGEEPHTITPDYMVGYSGVLVCLLRLAGRRPDPLSLEGFVPAIERKST